MSFFLFAVSVVIGVFGIYLGIRAFKNFKEMTQRVFPIKGLIVNAIMAGVATTLIFFSIVLMMGFLDKTYTWTKSSLQGGLIISLLLGGIVTLGSFLQSLMVAGYRGILLKTLRKKDKEE